jgi:hypothetical protein
MREEAKKLPTLCARVNEVKVLVTEVHAAATQADRARVLATIKGEPITSADIENALLPMIFDGAGASLQSCAKTNSS